MQRQQRNVRRPSAQNNARPARKQIGAATNQDAALRNDISEAMRELREKDLPTLGLSFNANKESQFVQNSTQAFVPFKSITKKGTILTRDGGYLRILEISPINFFVLDEREQDDIIMRLAPLFKTGPMKIRFKTIVMPANKESYLDLMRTRMEEEENTNFKQLIQSHIDMCEDISGDALERRFFIIFEYERSRTLKTETMADIENALDRTESYIISTLRCCGNDIVVQNRTKDGYNRQFAAMEILFTFYNKYSAEASTVLERIGRIVKDYMDAHGMDYEKDPIPNIPIPTYIAPRGIDLTHKDCIIMDGRYYTFLYITSRGYPLETMAGWPNCIVNAGEGVELDMQFNRLDNSMVLKRLNRRMSWNEALIGAKNNHDNDFQTLQGAYASGGFIKNSIANRESIHNMYTIITVSAAKQQDLYAKIEYIKKSLAAYDIDVRDCNYDMEDALRTVSPGVYIGANIARKAKRNITMMGAAASYMMLSYELSDHDGIMIGTNDQNGTMCMFNPFLASQYPNANLIILGSTGSGKSYAMHDISLHMRMKGIPVYTLTPAKGMDEFLRITNAIGGEFVHVSGSSPTHINIMDIWPVDKGDETYLVGANCSLGNDSLLLAKMETLNTFMQLLVEDWDDECEYITDKAVKAAYEKYGITEDNDSIYTDDTHTVLKDMPILSDLQEAYREIHKSKKKDITESEKQKALACDKKLERYTTGPLKSFNHRTNVDFNNKYMVFDFESMKSERAVGLFIVLQFLFALIRRDRTKNKVICIDELWAFLSSQDDIGRDKKMEKAQANIIANFVISLSRLVRGWGGALITATQQIRDLFSLNDGSFGSAIINNCKSKLILNIESTEIEDMKSICKLTDSEIRQIRTSDRGHGLLWANEKKIQIHTCVSDLEHDLITTDPLELKAQVERERQKLLAYKKTQNQTKAG